MRTKEKDAGSARVAQGNRAELVAFIRNTLVSVLETSPEKIATNAPFEQFGLDSVAAIDLMSALSKKLQRNLDPTLPYKYSTIDLLSDHLTEGHDRQP